MLYRHGNLGMKIRVISYSNDPSRLLGQRAHSKLLWVLQGEPKRHDEPLQAPVLLFVFVLSAQDTQDSIEHQWVFSYGIRKIFYTLRCYEDGGEGGYI